MNYDFEARQAKLKDITTVDAVAIVPGANMFYFTGLEFHLSERPVIGIFSAMGVSFIVPELEVIKLTNHPDLEANIFSWGDAEGFEQAFTNAVKDLGLDEATLGLDGLTMRVFEMLAFQQSSATNILDVGQNLLDIRARKTAEEVQAMREAIRLSERALDKLLQWMEPGMTELEMGRELSRLLKAEGSSGESFEPLVQVGANSALPHGFSGDRQLGENDFLLIDFGGRARGYPADITRTFCLGTPTAEMQKIYDVVLEANKAAQTAAGPGVACGVVDEAARNVIEAAGYGEYFTHRTGHGLGLEIHELPQIAAGVVDVLEPGMVFTIEPGIYIPGLGGVRIEDNVVVTQSGLDVLTEYPRQLTLRVAP